MHTQHARTHTHMHACMHAPTPTLKLIYMHACTHTYSYTEHEREHTIHTHAHTHAHMHTCTHTYTLHTPTCMYTIGNRTCVDTDPALCGCCTHAVDSTRLQILIYQRVVREFQQQLQQQLSYTSNAWRCVRGCLGWQSGPSGAYAGV